ncbi:hypothetical protein ABI_41550 [Asticcacaulis biprosthecium C19]|uniref:DUF1800 domain-containing protein n=1 Tax=Asticcacaulis biprosthecium C19 TaxID=715226 RepID=F4QSL2_9CAUL|nr:DUF1800 family protein [Asticcacaulis biprosthecium]EGF89732.1 hypothetical protein ABI_41550 [Asticcacaulis biprosthecium C19]
MADEIPDVITTGEAETAPAPEARSTRRKRDKIFTGLGVTASAALLAACGGSSGGAGGGSAAGSSAAGGNSILNAIGLGGLGGPTGALQAPTENEAARFLSHATFGPTMAEIRQVQSLGYDGWLNQQFIAPRRDTHFGYVTRGGPLNCGTCDRMYVNAFLESLWQQVAEDADSLRQRIAFTLTELFVVSEVNSPLEGNAHALASYLDMLADRCFGNFRQLLEGVALHPAMGHYLSHIRNEKEDATTGRIPDENFAREVMQLFTIGLWELNVDGTRRKSTLGKDIPTYTQKDISGMAKVFTGWSWGGPDDNIHRWYGWPIDEVETVRWDLPMRHYQQFASVSEKRIIRKVVIPANTGAVDTMRIALDTLFNHPNVGPFIGKQLIQRLVTSNPSPEYVSRVAKKFNNNGEGVRGDMRAVIRAILTDMEATSETSMMSDRSGKIREPIIRFGSWLRAFGARSTTGIYPIWNLEDTVWSIGQNPLRAPSVFNWFRPDYAPQGEIADAGLVAPEFQIAHETTVTGWANFAFSTAFYGHGWDENRISASYAEELPLADDPPRLVDRVNLLLTGRQLDRESHTLILEAVESFPLDAENGRYIRCALCVAMTMISPQFQMQR